MIRRRRACDRFVIRMPAEVSAGGYCFRGRTVRISEKGFFVKLQKSFREGTPVGIRLWLPDGKESAVKGVVKYARRINFLTKLNGMGIELTEKDAAYTQFIRGLKGE